MNLAPGLDRNGLSFAGHGFGEVVGMALRAAGPTPAGIKLQPPSVTEKKRNQRQRPAVFAALAVLVVLFGAVAGSLYAQIQAAHATLGGLQHKIGELQALADKIAPIEERNAALSGQFGQAQKILGQRDTWTRLLSDINGKVPQGVWITQLIPTSGGQAVDSESRPGPGQKGGAPRPAAKPSAEGPDQAGATQITQIQIKGMFEDGRQPDIINQFVTGLADLGWFELTADKVSNAILSTDTPQPNAGQLGWNFTLSLRLKQPISLEP